MKHVEILGYPDEDVARWAEMKAHNIRLMVRRTVEAAVEVGRELLEVKARLPHGTWEDWLSFHFGWSDQQARNYMRLAEAAEQNPKVFEFASLTAAYQFARLPPPVQQRVLDAKAFRLSAFQGVLDDERRREWREAMEERLRDDRLEHGWRCGTVLAAVEEALADEVLRPEAEALAVEHAETFSRLADRPAHEVLAEAGVRREARRPESTARKAWAVLAEGQNGDRCPCCGQRVAAPGFAYDLLQVWTEGGPETVAVFRVPGDPVLRAWQNAVVAAAVERTGARTAEALAEETL